MHTGWLRLLSLLVLPGALALAADKAKPSPGAKASGDGHAKEELGVNQFTTPSIATLLEALRELRPVPFEKVERTITDAAPPDRARLALGSGVLIADGFLAVAAEKGSRIEPVGRALLKHAKALGVADYASRHAKSIIERAARKDWEGTRAELIGAQRDVERGMMALRDEEIAHLIALGGWWRGLEITAAIVAESHTPERAALLVQPSVLDYFADRVSTLNPRLKAGAIFPVLDKNLRELRALTVREDRKPPAPDAVEKIRDLARETVRAITNLEK